MYKFSLLLLLSLFNASIHAADDSWLSSYNLEANGQYIAAAQTLEPILRREPANEMALLRSGWLYYLAGNYSRSVTYYQSALQANKYSLEARLGMSLPLLAQSRWREAALQSQAVIKESRWNYYAHLRLMVCEEGLKQWDDLKRHAEELVLRYPTDASFLVYLARAHIKLGEPAQAKIAYAKVLERYPGHLEASQFLVK